MPPQLPMPPQEQAPPVQAPPPAQRATVTPTAPSPDAAPMTKEQAKAQLSSMSADAMRQLLAEAGINSKGMSKPQMREALLEKQQREQRQNDEPVETTPATKTPEQNAADGLQAMNRAIAEKADVFDAMHRPEVGSISFYWGKPGDAAKNYRNGEGISHLIARRNLEGQDGEAVARKMPEVIARGEVGEIYGPEGGERRNVSHNGHTAVLSLYKMGNKKTWLLTGWKDNPADATGAVNAPSATHSRPSGIQNGVGAAKPSSVNQDTTPAEKVKPSTSPSPANAPVVQSGQQENANVPKESGNVAQHNDGRGSEGSPDGSGRGLEEGGSRGLPDSKRDGARDEGSSGRNATEAQRGNQSRIAVPGQEKLPVAYEIVEAGDVRASHLPLRGFQKNPTYGLENERRYHDEPAGRDKVNENASRLDPDLLLDAPDANQGAPVVDHEGNVIGGNGRAMSIQKAYESFPQRGDAYKAALAANAERLGLDPATVSGMKQPMLIRRLEGTPSREARQKLVSSLNEDFTHSREKRADSKSRGNRFSKRTLDALAAGLRDADSLREYFDTAESGNLVDMLIADGVIQKAEKTAYVGADGLLNPDGKTLVEQALRGRVVSSYEVLAKLPAAVVGKLDGVIPHILIAENVGKGWSITKHVSSAMDVIADFVASGIKSPQEFLRKVNMLAGKAPVDTASKEAVAIFNAMLERNKTDLKKDFAKYAGEAGVSPEAGGLIAKSPQQSFAEHIAKVPPSKREKAPAPVREVAKPADKQEPAARQNGQGELTNEERAERAELAQKPSLTPAEERRYNELNARVWRNRSGIPSAVLELAGESPGMGSDKPLASLRKDVATEDKAAKARDYGRRVKEAAAKWAKVVDDFFAGKLHRRSIMQLGQTPDLLVDADIGIPSLPLVMEHGIGKKISGQDPKYQDAEHKLSPKQMKEIVEKLADPVMVLRSDGREAGHFVVVTDMPIGDAPIVVGLFVDETQGRIQVNSITTAFGKNNFAHWLGEDNGQARKGHIAYLNKTKSDSLLQDRSAPQLARVLEQNRLSGNKIVFDNQVVKPVYETQQKADSPLASFAGERSNMSAPVRANLAEAQRLADAGTDNEAIRQKTGWFKGMDGKWRYEIADLPEKIDLRAIDVVPTKLDAVYNNPQLYEAYPWLRDMKIEYNPTMFARGGLDGDTIFVKVPRKDVLLHEIQHAIQNYEGFAIGGNQSIAGEAANALRSEMYELRRTGKDPDRLRQIETQLKGTLADDFAAYKKLAGEIEARDVAERSGLTNKKRILKSPNLQADAIVLFGDKLVAAYSLDTAEKPSLIPPSQHLSQPRNTTERVKPDILKRVVDELSGRAKNAPETEVVKSFDELPERLQKALVEMHGEEAANKAEGVYDRKTGTVWMVADNITDTERAAQVWLHEARHNGLRSLFTPAELKRVLSNMWMKLGGMNNERVREKAKEYGYDLRNEEHRERVVEEVLADMQRAQQDGKLTKQEQGAWKRFVELVKEAFDRIVKAVTGRDSRLEFKTVEDLLRTVDAHIFDGEGVKTEAKPEARAEAKTPLDARRETEHAAWEQLQKDKAEWGKHVDAWKKSPHENRSLTVGQTPDVLRKLGAKAKTMAMMPKNLDKVHNEKGIPLETLKDLPEKLADPLMVFKSATMADSLVVLTELEHKGENLIAAVHMNVAHGSMLINDIASVHDRAIKDGQGRVVTPGWQWFKGQIEKGNLRYYDKTRSPRWFRERSGLQLSGVLNRESYRGTKILTEQDIVKPVNNKTEASPTTHLDTDDKPLASLRSIFGMKSGVAAQVANDPEISHFFSKDDLGLLSRLTQLPHWIAEKYPKFKAIYERQLRRTDERSAALADSLRQLPSLFGKDANLAKQDMDDLNKLIWDSEGKQVDARVAELGSNRSAVMREIIVTALAQTS